MITLLTIYLLAFPQCFGFSRAAQLAALRYSFPAVRRLLRYDLCITSGYYQRLYDILPRLIHRVGLPCFLHCVRDLFRAVLRPQILLQDAMDSQSVRT